VRRDLFLVAGKQDNGKPAVDFGNTTSPVGPHWMAAPSTPSLESLARKKERDEVVSVIKNSGKEIIEISMDQMNHFAGNMLQVNNRKDEKLLVMSTQAYESLSPKQVKKLSSFNKIIHSSLTTIETNGGGSARCMMAEVHLPEK